MRSEVGLPPFGHLAYLKAGDTQQYMFRLKGKVPPQQLKQVQTLGRMDVVWKTAMGEVICSRYSSPKEGSGMLNELPPKSSVRTAACRRLSPSLAA